MYEACIGLKRVHAGLVGLSIPTDNKTLPMAIIVASAGRKGST
ncbi:hypothetical protein THTE_3496 [Thermogutta terrifontis]|uniref:Uncharacterized protein n=1 Tax=Thermogutta terrifontis TaxID=1331910 RepID=A0A286RJG2_9BACT|nr:hypothetical protein THTE_3496 [Thermogutta terrifontis]